MKHVETATQQSSLTPDAVIEIFMLFAKGAGWEQTSPMSLQRNSPIGYTLDNGTRGSAPLLAELSARPSDGGVEFRLTQTLELTGKSEAEQNKLVAAAGAHAASQLSANVSQLQVLGELMADLEAGGLEG